jgi:hypothetical protein
VRILVPILMLSLLSVEGAEQWWRWGRPKTNPPTTTTPPPSELSDLPLLTSAMVFQDPKGFCPPDQPSGGIYFDFSPQATFALNPPESPTSIFAVKSGNAAQGYIGHFNIPTPVFATSAASLPVATYAAGGMFEPTEGLGPAVSAAIGGGAQFNPNGLLVYGNRLLGVSKYFYDNRSGNIPAFWSRPLNPLTLGDVDGLESLTVVPGTYGAYDIQRYHNTFLTQVPTEWQEALGGTVFAGAGHSDSVESTQSYGFSLFTYDPDDVTYNGSQDAVMNTLVMYPPGHRTLGEATDWPPPSPYFSFAMGIEGGVAIAGTRTFIAFGTDGTHDSIYAGYGPGTADISLHGTPYPDPILGPHQYNYDPPNAGASGGHMWPYSYKAYFYDMLDFLAVKNGTMNAWDIRPYEMVTPTFPIVTDPAGSNQIIYGGAYDKTNHHLYVTEYPSGCAGNGANGAFWRFTVDITP